jgi:exodeoxyribonuclease VII large subunit
LIGRQALTELAQHGAFGRMTDLIRQRQQKIDDLHYRLEKAERALLERQRRRSEAAMAAVRHYDVRRMLAATRQQLDAKGSAMAAVMRSLLARHARRAETATARLEALSPLAILERGYALVFDAAGNLVKDAARVAAGDEISARLARGEITATVKKTSS